MLIHAAQPRTESTCVETHSQSNPCSIHFRSKISTQLSLALNDPHSASTGIKLTLMFNPTTAQVLLLRGACRVLARVPRFSLSPPLLCECVLDSTFLPSFHSLCTLFVFLDDGMNAETPSLLPPHFQITLLSNYPPLAMLTNTLTYVSRKASTS